MILFSKHTFRELCMLFVPKTIDAVVVYTDIRQRLTRSFRNECLPNTSKSFYRLGFFSFGFRRSNDNACPSFYICRITVYIYTVYNTTVL